jgi:hypothetical protein
MKFSSQRKIKIFWLGVLWLGGVVVVLKVLSAPFPVNLIFVVMGVFLVLFLTLSLLREPKERTGRTNYSETSPGLSPRLSPGPKKMEEGRESVLDKKDASQELQDLATTPQETMDIIGAYGGVLAELADKDKKLKPKDRKLLRPTSQLPYPKEKIEEALKIALRMAKDEDSRKQLDSFLLELDSFAADEEVPDDPRENQLAWIRRLTVKGQKNVKSTT